MCFEVWNSHVLSAQDAGLFVLSWDLRFVTGLCCCGDEERSGGAQR